MTKHFLAVLLGDDCSLIRPDGTVSAYSYPSRKQDHEFLSELDCKTLHCALIALLVAVLLYDFLVIVSFSSC